MARTRHRISNTAICLHCAGIFPNVWPQDRVLDSGTLTPVNAARLVLVFTRIRYGARLEELHDECLVNCLDWLRRLRTASRTLRVVSVERPLFELYSNQLHAARETIQRELRERAESSAPDPQDIEHALRNAMDAVGWESFGLTVDHSGQRALIVYPADQEMNRVRRLGVFQWVLRDTLGAETADKLELGFQTLDD